MELFLVEKFRGEDFRDGSTGPIILVIKLIVCDALLRPVNDRGAGAAGANLRVKGLVGEVHVHLGGAFEREHGKLVFGVNFRSLTFENLNL